MIQKLWNKMADWADELVNEIELSIPMLLKMAEYQCLATIIISLIFNAWTVIHWCYMNDFPASDAFFGNLILFLVWIYCEHFYYAVIRKINNNNNNNEQSKRQEAQ